MVAVLAEGQGRGFLGLGITFVGLAGWMVALIAINWIPIPALALVAWTALFAWLLQLSQRKSERQAFELSKTLEKSLLAFGIFGALLVLAFVVIYRILWLPTITAGIFSGIAATLIMIHFAQPKRAAAETVDPLAADLET